MIRLFLVAFAIGVVTSCTSIDDNVMASESQLALRQIQTREFTDIGKEDAMRAVIATLQDLGFVVDKADLVLGSVSATKLQQYTIVMTVTVRQREGSVMVRANANYQKTTINDPEPYQNFFTALDKAIFLQKNKVG